MKYTKCTPINGKDAVLISARLVRANVSNKAYLVETENGLHWIPKKVSNKPHFERNIMAVEQWYFEKILSKEKAVVENYV